MIAASGNREQHAENAEQRAEGQQREDHPHGMEMNALAHQLRRQHVALERPADHEHSTM